MPWLWDELRQYHPEYQQLLTLSNPQAMPNATAEFSGWMVRRAIAEAAENTYSARVEGTFRQARTTLDTVRNFREHGFETHVVVVGVREETTTHLSKPSTLPCSAA